jgi:polyhydroxyalkanoate depolymerase
MLYTAYEAQATAMTPWRLAAALTAQGIGRLPPSWSEHPLLRLQKAWSEVIVGARITHTRPSFGLHEVSVAGGTAAVEERRILETEFGRLLHFEKDLTREEPRVLLVAPLAGHFSTLLRDTVETLLFDHDVYLAEWFDARDVPLTSGRFGLPEYIGHLVGFIEALGPGTHVISVCQPCPATIAAASLLAQAGSAAQPRSLILMAGPVDTSRSPTKVNEVATSRDLRWFDDNVVTTVPAGHEGYGRRVYPGFLQLTAFASMNPARHLNQHFELLRSLYEGREARARAIREFYDEYFAVLDLHADFYLETVDAVFQRNLLARGQLTWNGNLVEPSAISRTALLTVEGERDDVCGLGQTLAAHDLLSSVDPSNKAHHLQAGAGHYGVFSGRRWRTETYPIVRDFILLHA